MLYCDEQQNPLGKGTGCAVPIQPARTDDFDVVETEVLRLQVYSAPVYLQIVPQFRLARFKMQRMPQTCYGRTAISHQGMRDCQII